MFITLVLESRYIVDANEVKVTSLVVDYPSHESGRIVNRIKVCFIATKKKLKVQVEYFTSALMVFIFVMHNANGSKSVCECVQVH